MRLRWWIQLGAGQFWFHKNCMDFLILSPRQSEDTQALWRAALQAGWHIERAVGWEPPVIPAGSKIAIYGEPILSRRLAEAYHHVLMEPAADWLIQLEFTWKKRAIKQGQLHEFMQPVTWEVEYRCFVFQGNVETLSPYWRAGRLAQSADGEWVAPHDEQQQAVAFAEDLLRGSKASLPEAIVLDVGKIEGQGWAAVEANACWASGLYGCDSSKALEIIQSACVPYEQNLDRRDC